ncbi:hypothetical protein LQW54_012106 [Pestalotiopsis sp. IQ-011]
MRQQTERNGQSKTEEKEADPQLPCLFDHGGLSERSLAYYSSVIATASSPLCSASASAPTAPFATLFASAAAKVPIPTTGGTVSSDTQSGNWGCFLGDGE